jgi:hypothetical protein
MKAKYNRIGTAKGGIGEPFHLSYVGPRTDLKGFTAKVRLVRAPYKGCVAQFNSSRTGYHHGWFRFKIMDFYGWPAESLSNEALLREVGEECRKSVIDVHPRSRKPCPQQ